MVTAPAVTGALPTVTVSIPPSLVAGPPATITLGVDSVGNKLINVDTGTSRLTLSVPAASFTDVATALAGLDSQTVSTVSGPATIGDEYAQQIAALASNHKTHRVSQPTRTC